MTIVDVTNKSAPVQLSRTGYPNDGYVHQGWLTADQTYFIHDDELDEAFFGHNTRTYVWDVSDLDNPIQTGFHEHGGGNIDHNLYVADGIAYLSNYSQGLRVMEVTDAATAQLTQVGYFDTFPENDGTNFSGSWSNYPFLPSGIILVSDTTRGFFILQRSTGSPLGCESLERFQTRCRRNGKLQFRVVLEDSSFEGETVSFLIDGTTQFDSTVVGDKARGQLPVAPGSQHTISVIDPVGCFPDQIVTCSE